MNIPNYFQLQNKTLATDFQLGIERAVVGTKKALSSL